MDTKKTKAELIGDIKALRSLVVKVEQRSKTHKRSNHLLREFIDVLPDCGCSFDSDGIVIEVLAGKSSCLRADAPRLQGQSLHHFLPQEDAEILLAAIKETLESGRTKSFEFQFSVLADRRWFLGKTTLANNGTAGRPTIICILEDITDQKTAACELINMQEQLEQRLPASGDSEKTFRNLIEELPLGIIITQETKPIFVNQALAKFLGYESPDEILELGSIVQIKPDYEAERMTSFREARLRGEEVPDRYEVDFLRKDGSVVATESLVKVIEWSGVHAIQNTVIDITERRRSEDELRESEKRFRALIEGSNQGIVIHRDFKPLFANQTYAKILGFSSRKEVLKVKNINKLNAPCERKRIQNYLLQRKQGTEVAQRFTSQAIRKDGEVIWIDVNIQTIEWEGQEATQTTIVDISDRIIAERALHDNQRLLETVFNIVPLSLWAKDIKGRYLKVNVALAKSYDATTGDFEGLLTEDTLVGSAEDRAGFVESDRQVFESGESVDLSELIVTMPNGEKRLRHVVKLPVQDAKGNVTGLVGFSEDITEQKQAEAALQESEAKYRDLVETSQDLIWRSDEQGRFTYLNPAWKETLGYDPEEMLGRPYTDFKKLEEVAHTVGLYKQFLAGKNVTDQETTYVSKSGEEHTLIFKVKQIIDDSGQPVGLQGTAQDITERRQAEEALQESEARYARAVAGTDDGIWEWNIETGEDYFSPRWLAILGYEEGDLAPDRDSFIELIHPEDQEIVLAALEAHIVERAVYDVEIRMRCKNGEYLWIRSRGLAEKDEEGEPVRMAGSISDISDRKRAEEELRNSQRLLQTVFDTIPHWIYVKDKEFRILMANRGMESEIDIGEKEIEGVHTLQLKTGIEGDIKRILSSDQEVYEIDGRVEIPPYAVTLATGKKSIRQEVKLPLHDDEGNVIGLVGVSEDITERRRVEEALEEKTFELNSILTSLVDGVIAICEKGTILSVNPAVERIFGYTEEELIGQNVKMCMPEPYHSEHDGYLKNYTTTGVAKIIGYGREVSGRRKDGTDFPLELSISETTTTASFRMFTGIVRDITERKQLEEQLRESQKMEAVGQLAGGIAHEFNNMLQVIINSVYFARDSLHEPQLAKDWLGTTLKSAERSATLTKQLLAYSRRTALVPTRVIPNEMVSNVMKMVRPIIGEDIQLEFRQADELFSVKADATLLEQTLVNLCVNARDAMPDGGHLIFETGNHHADQEYCDLHGWKQPGDYALVSVSDNGIGMTTEIREHMFEPFFTTKEVGQGTGLGLSMVHGIVQQHDGEIEVLSEPGVGTTFNIYLPKADSQEARREKPVVSDSSGGNETVLVAEDDENVLNIQSKTLESTGYRVLTAKDGEEALSVFKANADRIDLVILDMVMPKLRGREVYEQIRESGSDVPVLFSTGYPLDSRDAEYVAGKGLHTIQKPYAPDVLYAAVRKVLDQR